MSLILDLGPDVREDFVGIPQLDVGSVVKGDLYDMVVVNPILIEIRME